MTLVIETVRLPIVDRVVRVLETVFVYGGIAASCAIGLCAVLDWLLVFHTDIGAFIVDQYQNGERRFNPNGDIHGDWGNQIFAVLSAPMFIGMFLATFISNLRSQ